MRAENYINAVIAEPTTPSAVVGIAKVGRPRKPAVQRHHPRKTNPRRITDGGKLPSPLTSTRSGRTARRDAGWIANMRVARAAWQQEKFKKEFSSEPSYRHSLKEEAESPRHDG
jgi:hypothetical protein